MDSREQGQAAKAGHRLCKGQRPRGNAYGGKVSSPALVQSLLVIWGRYANILLGTPPTFANESSHLKPTHLQKYSLTSHVKCSDGFFFFPSHINK